MSLEELLRACAAGEAAAWERFCERFPPLVVGVVIRTGGRCGVRSRSVLDELVQETYLKLCRDHMRLLREFRPEHPQAFYGYLKVIAANVVHDHCRTLHSKKRGSPVAADDHALGERVRAIGAGAAEKTERAILLREVDEVLLSLGGAERARDRMIFWLYYRQGLTAEAIAGLPMLSLSVKGVESVIHRLTRLVRGRLVAAELGEPW